MTEHEFRGCPFANWPDEYHEYGHTMMDSLLTSLRRDFPKMTPEQAGAVLDGTALVSVLRFTSLPDKDGVRVRGVVGFTGVIPLDPDEVEQGIRFCKAVDDGDVILPMGSFVEAGTKNQTVQSDTARLLNGMAVKRILGELLNFDIEEPIPDNHPIRAAIDISKASGGSPYDAGDWMTHNHKATDSQYARSWALSLQVMAGDECLAGMRSTLAGKRTPLIACFCDVTVMREEGVAVAYGIEHIMEVGEIQENIAFYGTDRSRPN